LAVGDPAGPGAAELYHQAIVAAARRACGHGHLPSADASIQVDNPLCGDRVSMEVKVSDGRLCGIAHQVRGCLLCEAAASIIAENAVGGTAEDLARVHDALCDALAHGFNAGGLPWPALELFAPVVHHRSRHRCVTLAFEALARALAAARAPARARD
jgi:nitrogen fixation NifU-like protein